MDKRPKENKQYKPKRSLDLRMYWKSWNEGVGLEETQLEMATMASAFIQNEFLVKERDREVYIGYAAELLKVSTSAGNKTHDLNTILIQFCHSPTLWIGSHKITFYTILLSVFLVFLMTTYTRFIHQNATWISCPTSRLNFQSLWNCLDYIPLQH